MCDGRKGVIQCHSERALLRVRAGKRHPCDVQGMGESAECLRPDDTEVTDAAIVDLGEDAVEDVAE